MSHLWQACQEDDPLGRCILMNKVRAGRDDLLSFRYMDQLLFLRSANFKILGRLNRCIITNNESNNAAAIDVNRKTQKSPKKNDKTTGRNDKTMIHS